MRVSFFFFVLVFLFSCQKKSVTAFEYKVWVEDEKNGLRVSKTFNDLKFTLQYEPSEYVSVLKHRTNHLKSSDLTHDTLESKGFDYCILRIEAIKGETDPLKLDLKDDNEYFDRIDYLSFHVQNDFELIDGRDTFPCVLSHLERMYNIGPYVNLVLAFEKHKGLTSTTDSSKFLLYNDNTFGTGPIQFMISSAAIAKASDLKIITE